jgi:hypothetical protein
MSARAVFYPRCPINTQPILMPVIIACNPHEKRSSWSQKVDAKGASFPRAGLRKWSE